MSFICRECGLTWADHQNQETPTDKSAFSETAGDGICPNCHEGDEDEEEDHPWMRRP